MSFREVLALYGDLPATAFGKSKLKAVREAMIAGTYSPRKTKDGNPIGLSRGVVNQRVGRIQRVYVWAVDEGLVQETTAMALKAVRPLPKNRSAARETEDVKPVPITVIEATLPHLSPVVAAMIRLQLLTGMRPGEVCRMRPCDIDRSAGEGVWAFDLTGRHKMAYRTPEKVVYLGPQSQAVLAEIIRWDEPEGYVFRPTDAAIALGRKPNRRYRQQYRKEAYNQAIDRGVLKANEAETKRATAEKREAKPIPDWTPNQIRHTYATLIRQRYGLEGSQVALGHDKADTTQIYAEKDATLARRIAVEVG